MTQAVMTDPGAPAREHLADAVAAFGWERLRPDQERAVRSVLDGRDTLVLMPTGSGKSAVYQVASAVLGRPVVVVSPLIALQEDQVAGIAEHPDAPRAVAVNSTRSADERRAAWDALAAGEVGYLLVAPEQFADDAVVERLAAADVGLFVVDEAHCVSSWGHDFRPDYLLLGEVVERVGRPPVLAMTATGSPPVHEDVVRQLGLRDPEVVSGGFDRPEIRLEVRRHESADEKTAAVVDQVVGLDGRGIVYAATRTGTESLADRLAGHGLSVAAYHAGLGTARRAEMQRRFRAGEVDVVVATSAFGMGIDEPDLRFVVHADVPESLDALHQEIGRAGRDGRPAVATLHYREEDLGLRRFFASGGSRPATLRAVYRAVPADGALRRADLARASGLTQRTATRGAAALVAAGVLLDEADGLRRADPATWADEADHVPSSSDAAGAERAGAERAGADADRAEDAVRRTRRRADDQARIERSRIEMMRRYAEVRSCRRTLLLGYFGEEHQPPCGNCDVCIEHPERAVVPDVATDDEWSPDTPVEHIEWGAGVVMESEDDRITVFFDHQGYKTLSRADIADRGLLTRR